MALGCSLVSVWVCRLLSELLPINVPWSQELSDVLELTLLSLAFGPSLTVASTLLHPYSIEDKTQDKNPHVIGETILHSQEHPERFTEIYREDKREEGVEVTRRRKGGVKRGESSLASNQIPVIPTAWNT